MQIKDAVVSFKPNVPGDSPRNEILEGMKLVLESVNSGSPDIGNVPWQRMYS